MPAYLSLTVTCTTGGPTPSTKTSLSFDVEFLGVFCHEKLSTLAPNIDAKIPYTVSTSTSSTAVGDWSTFFTNSD